MRGILTSARVTVRTYKHICSLPLVHRPKAVLLVVERFDEGVRGIGQYVILRFRDSAKLQDEMPNYYSYIPTASLWPWLVDYRDIHIKRPFKILYEVH